ncbi:MAG: hypothetical protein QOC76_4032 [Mycobacterium sp.]|nr:hypothetical protein [Mycobacterium sp.]
MLTSYATASALAAGGVAVVGAARAVANTAPGERRNDRLGFMGCPVCAHYYPGAPSAIPVQRQHLKVVAAWSNVRVVITARRATSMPAAACPPNRRHVLQSASREPMAESRNLRRQLSAGDAWIATSTVRSRLFSDHKPIWVLAQFDMIAM